MATVRTVLVCCESCTEDGGRPSGRGLVRQICQTTFMVVSNEGKVHKKWACEFCEDERK